MKINQEPEPLGKNIRSRSRLKKKSGAGAAWEKYQATEPEPLKNLPAPQPCALASMDDPLLAGSTYIPLAIYLSSFQDVDVDNEGEPVVIMWPDFSFLQLKEIINYIYGRYILPLFYFPCLLWCIQLLVNKPLYVIHSHCMCSIYIYSTSTVGYSF